MDIIGSNVEMKRQLNSMVLILLSALLMISVNFCASKLSEYFGLRLDLTGNQLYQISQETESVLGGLKVPIQIKVLSSKEDFLPLVDEVLQEYQRIGQDKIQLQYIDPYVNPTLLDQYLQQGLQVDVGSVVVQGEKYSRSIQLDEMFQLDSSQQKVESLKCEQMLTSAILDVAGKGASLASFTAGHNETISNGLRELFIQNNYKIGHVTLEMVDVPESTDLLIVASPSTDFSANEIKKLDGFMADGGRMMVFLESGAGQLTNLNEFLTEWGIAPTEAIVAEKLQYVDGEPLHIVPIYAVHDITRYFADNQIYLVMPDAKALDQVFVSQAGIHTSKLLYSTDRAYLIQSGEERSAPFTLAMTAEKSLGLGKARIFVAGSRHIYDDNLLYQNNYSNNKFISQVMRWCTEQDSSVSIPPKQLNDAAIAITVEQVRVLSILFLAVFPIGILICGFAIYYCRRQS